MSELVIDASVAAALLLDDEREPRADKALEHMKTKGAIAPLLWQLETRNALLAAERRGSLSQHEVQKRLEALNGLPIQTKEPSDLQTAFDLARSHGVSLYDALYLELAKRENAELATLDKALGRAAVAEGVPLTVA